MFETFVGSWASAHHRLLLVRPSFASTFLVVVLVATALSASPAAKAGDMPPAPATHLNASGGSGIGSGRALVRIDASQARATQVGERTFTLLVPSGSDGQWMGERVDRRGVVRLRTGELTAKALATSWKNLKYSSSGAIATLVWQEEGQRSSARVRIFQPKVANSHVTFTVQTGKAGLPATLADLSINIRRAPSVSTPVTMVTSRSSTVTFIPFSESVPLTDGLFFSTSVSDALNTNNMLYDSAHPSGCWSISAYADVYHVEWDVYPPNMNCGGVALSDSEFVAILPDSGETTDMVPYEGEEDWYTQFFTTITPPGEASMYWWDDIACWDKYGEVEYC